MNCEQVEARLSAYLDNMLASDERQEVTIHLQTCPRCMMLLAVLRQNDMLLARLPRVSPSPELRARLFALPEVRKLMETANPPPRPTSPLDFSPSNQTPETSELSDHARLSASPQGHDRQTQSQPLPAFPQRQSAFSPSSILYNNDSYPTRVRKRQFLFLKIALAVVLIVALGSVSLLSFSLRGRSISAKLVGVGAMTPPAGPLIGQTIPLAAGSRFVFLRENALWSTLADGGDRQPERLTPAHTMVAPGWIVNPPQGKHDAGDLLAYIDLQGARVHIVRSDGQQDKPIQLALVRTNSTTIWQSAEGQTILASLAWSPDSSTLAFVADPTGSGQTGLYLASPGSGAVHAIAKSLKGSFAHPVWSPDGTQLAFTLTSEGAVSVLTYDLQSENTLDLSNLEAAQARGTDDVLTLAWFTHTGQAAVTWSLGSIGRISSLWIFRPGASYPQQLVSGTYLQALYCPGGTSETGGWLLVASVAGQAGDIWHLNLIPGDQLVRLSRDKQVGFVRWSPDGSTIFYLNNVAHGMGNGHLIDVVNGIDQSLPDRIAVSPAPDWSADGQQLAYSTGTRVDVVDISDSSQFIRLHIQGQVVNLSWSPTVARYLIVSLNDPDPDFYLADTQHNISREIDSAGTDSELQWTQIP